MKGKIHIDGSAYLILALYLLLMPFQWVAAMILAAAVHEMGHCIALYLLGEPIVHIEIRPFGAKIETMPMEERKIILCALAGPMSGLILCLFGRWLPKIAMVAFAQSVFNLLPVYPLDGGRILRAVKQWRKR